jgi:hypothetical protein
MSATATNRLFNRRRRWATRLLIFGLFFAAFFAAYRYVLGRVVAAKLEAIRNAGYPVTLAELDKWYPQTPANGNGAELFGVAFDKLTIGTNLTPLPRADLAALSPQATPLSAATRQAVANVLASNADAIALLHEAASTRRSRYPLNLGRLSLLPYPHLVSLHRSAYLLELEALGYAEQENPALAARSVDSLLGLARSLATEPLARSYLARLECQRIAVVSLQQVLNKTTPTDSQLSSLSGALEQANNSYSLSRAFIGQRCIGVYAFELMGGMADVWRMTLGRNWPWWQRLVIRLTVFFGSSASLYDASGLLQWDELCYLGMMDRYIEAARAEFPQRLATARALQSEVRQLPRFHVFTGQWLRAMNGANVILKDASLTARLRAARVALAIERYRLVHGQPPETLAPLTPTYLKTALTDPFDPAAAGLRYKRLAKGYVVYSIGEDARDDGGDAGKDITFVLER